MKILLVSVNQEHFPEPVFPLGAVYVADSLMKKNITVHLFDLGTKRFPNRSLMNEVLTFKPDIIGISLRNIDNAAYPHVKSYLNGYKLIVDKIKSLTKSPVILGGSVISIFPKEIMKVLDVDRVVIGEGEGIDFLEKKDKICKGYAHIANVAFPKDIKKIFPDFDYYKTIGIQTARGCPNKCIYCTYPIIEGSNYRFRQPEMVAHELEFLSKFYNKRSFFIVDSSFNNDESHMERVLKEIIKRNLKINFSCYLQPKMDDLSLFSLLKEAGSVGVDFGTDSGSTTVLKSLAKNFDDKDIIKVSEACKRNGIDFCHSLIFGGPKEDVKTINETIKLMDYVSPTAVIAMTGVRIYPGTALEKIAINEGILEANSSLIEPIFYFGNLKPNLLLKEIYSATEERKNWFFPGRKDYSHSFVMKILRTLYRGGPLWKIMKKRI